MEFGEALRELQKYERFFRALKTMGEVLEDAQRATQAAVQAKETVHNAKEEVQNVTSGLANTKDALKKVKGQYEAKLAEMEEKLKAREVQLLAEADTKIAAKTEVLAKLQAEIEQASAAWDAKLEDYRNRAQTAATETKTIETRLSDAQKKYEQFKAKL